jgi:hypothetical protein
MDGAGVTDAGASRQARGARRGLGRVAALGAALLAAAAVAPAAGLAAPPAPVQAPAAPLVIAVDGARLTVDVRDADLAEVLQRIAGAAGFHLTITGQLGRVTAGFADVALDEGLRRLVQDNELMLVYRPQGGGGSALDEVQVYAGVRGPAAPAPPGGPGHPSTGMAMAEIYQLVRARDDPASMTRLVEVLGSDADPAVRARAAWAVGRIGGADAMAALMRAVGDPSPGVRIQAIYGLRRADSTQALPVLRDLLLSDPDAGSRRAAARALSTLQEPAAAAALAAAAQDQDPGVRLEVSRGLRRLGSGTP